MAVLASQHVPRLSEEYVMVDHVPQDTASNDYLESISSYIEDLSSDLRRISLSIHDNPELQFKEFHAHRVLTEYLQKQDSWQVTPSAYDIKTAFVALFDSGKKGPVVSFNAEYDALRGLGHACGHNLIAIVSLGAALATAKVMQSEELGGKVVLFGTPAEEGGGGKIKLLNAGAYKDNKVDISLMCHPGIDADAALVRTSAHAGLKVEYHGKEAHAAARPWEGINALDALVTAYNAISVMRQQTQPGDTIQAQITYGGDRPNIIHAYTAGRFTVRSTSKARLEALKKRVVACCEAGATATGASVQLTWDMSYDDHMPNHALGRSYRHFYNRLGGSISHEIQRNSASTDQGNISYAMPSLHPGFFLRVEDDDGNQLGGNHTPDFERAARTKESHEYAKRAAKALAATAVDVLTRPGLLDEIKREFEKMKREE